MANTNYKYLNENMVNEISELFAGEHSEALTAWTLECTRAAKLGLIEASAILAGVTGVIGGGIYIGKKIVQGLNKKDKKQLEEDFVESE